MPDEMLCAEDVWSGDIVFIKRPTRYYCVRSATCMDGGDDDTVPVALPNGLIVCEDELPKSTRNDSEGKIKESTIAMVASARRRANHLFSPKTYINPGAVRRIFIT
ncbi:unnamed protein product [Phytomonas sp. Hart1]|nr:unnamed protein product [Phytomonas sp. Hart1]|eukprot:CCW66597.1 unnamed protein product [Phytomonas sp. isolate Hart1]